MKYILLYHTFFKFIYFIFNDSRALVLHFSKAWEVFVLNGKKSIRFSFNGVRGQIKLCCLLCLLYYTNSQYTYTSKRTLKSLKLICLKAYLIRFLVVVVIVMPGRCSGVQGQGCPRRQGQRDCCGQGNCHGGEGGKLVDMVRGRGQLVRSRVRRGRQMGRPIRPEAHACT